MRKVTAVLISETSGYGGIGEYAGFLAQALVNEGWDVTLATAREHSYGESLPGVTMMPAFTRVTDRRPLGRWLRRRGLARPLTGLLQLLTVARLVPVARRVGVIHTQGAFEPPLTLAQHVLWRAAGAGVVHTPHNTFDRVGGVRRHIKRLVEYSSDIVIVHANADLPSLPPRLRRRSVVIPLGEWSGVAGDAESYDRESVREELGFDHDIPVGLLYGHLRPDKGVDVLLKAVAQVPGMGLIVAGEDRGALTTARPLFDDPRLSDRVTLREGFQSTDVSARLFAACDFVVLPYQRASSSAFLHLAYGFERAAVVFPVGGLPEAVIVGKTGWVCEDATVEALTATLNEVVSLPPEEWRRRGRAGAALAQERFSWPAIAQRTVVEAYRPALHRRGLQGA